MDFPLTTTGIGKVSSHGVLRLGKRRRVEQRDGVDLSTGLSATASGRVH